MWTKFGILPQPVHLLKLLLNLVHVTKVKFCAKADNRKYIDAVATEAQSTANRGDQAVVYNITTQLCGKKSNRNIPIKKREGVVLNSAKEQEERWIEHLREYLTGLTQPVKQCFPKPGICPRNEDSRGNEIENRRKKYFP